MAKPFAKSFYASRVWRTVRQQALRRDSYTCCLCGGHATEVHHLIELTPQNISDMRIALGLDNLQSLCWLCHNKETICAGDLPDGYVFDGEGNVVPIGARR